LTEEQKIRIQKNKEKAEQKYMMMIQAANSAAAGQIGTQNNVCTSKISCIYNILNSA
jgi:hypothetical protein